jgi:hypothetical protein
MVAWMLRSWLGQGRRPLASGGGARPQTNREAAPRPLTARPLPTLKTPLNTPPRSTEEPFWLKTVVRMNAYALHPEEAPGAASRHFLEYPRAPAAAAAAAGPLELHLEASASARAPRGAGWRAIGRGAAPELVARPISGGAGGEAGARRGWWVLPGEPHPVYGEDDPLSADEAKALPIEELVQVRGEGRGSWGADAGAPPGCRGLARQRHHRGRHERPPTQPARLPRRAPPRRRTTGSAARSTAARRCSAARGPRRRACRGARSPPTCARAASSAG